MCSKASLIRAAHGSYVKVPSPFGDGLTLVIPPNGRVYPSPGEPKIGIDHRAVDAPHGCENVGDLAIEYDWWDCRVCGRKGRISGAWCHEAISDGLGHEKCAEKCSRNCPAPVYDDHEFIAAYDDWQDEE